jgi:hypothetical protein
MARYQLTQAAVCAHIRIPAGGIIATTVAEVQTGDMLWTATTLPPGAIPVGQNPRPGTMITGVDSIG